MQRLDPAPLLVSADATLVADVQRLSAAAGVVPDVRSDPATALGLWASAPVVLVGVDAVVPLGSVRPPRRPRVHVVGRAPVGDGIFRDALHVGAESVAELPTCDAWLVELLTDVDDGVEDSGVCIGVIGGSGGAGASVFAAALARTSARSVRTLLVDADPLGAGSDRVLGLEGEPGVRWDSLLQTTGRLGSRSLREALPSSEGLSVLSWPLDRAAEMDPVAVREVLSAGRRGYPVVVVDLPRHLDQVVEETLTRCDHVVLVVCVTVPGVAAGARLARRLPEHGPRRHLLVRGRPGGIDPTSLGKVLDVPLLTVMGDQRHLDEAVDLGVGPARHARGPLARAARHAVRELVTRA